MGRGTLLSDPVIEGIAQKYGVSVGQVVLAWDAARSVLPIPKASSQARQQENLAALDISLDADDVAAITQLGKPDGRMQDQDPAVYEEF